MLISFFYLVNCKIPEIKKEEFKTKLEDYIKNKVIKYKKVRNEFLYGI